MSSIKMFALLPKRPDVTREYFHDHWRHPHGTWGKLISTIQQYVQSHRIDTKHLAASQVRYEGCAEVWLDSLEDCRSLGNHPTYRKYLANDEPLFIDMAGIQFAFMDEEVLDSGPATGEQPGSADFLWKERERPVSIKLMQFVWGREPIQWGSGDLELGRSLGALRHVRATPNGILHPKGRALAVAPHATRPEHRDCLVGIRELWWSTESDFNEAVRNNRSGFECLITRPPDVYSMLCHSERLL